MRIKINKIPKTSSKWHKGQNGLEIYNNTQIKPEDVQYPQEQYSYTPAPMDRIQEGYEKGIIERNQNEYEPFSPQDIQDKKFNWDKLSKGIQAGLLTLDAIIPAERSKYPTVRPTESYTPHPYGTGSQAIAEYGTKISDMGYRADSPDKHYKQLTIPSNYISMANVPHDVYGVDNLGNSRIMKPGKNYQFPGQYVKETPLAQNGAEIQRMSPEEIDYFNGFINYVKDKGYQGDKKLNTGTLNEKLYSEYQKSNPSLTIPLKDLTLRAQQEQHYQKDFDTQFVERNDPKNAEAIKNSSISPLDGFFGSETSLRPIPTAERRMYNNNKLVSQTNLGYVPNSLNSPVQKTQKNPPAGVDIIDTTEGKGYFDPQTGNFIKLEYGGILSALSKNSKFKISNKFSGEILKNGGYIEGEEYEMDEDEIQSLLDNGYTLKYV